MKEWISNNILIDTLALSETYTTISLTFYERMKGLIPAGVHGRLEDRSLAGAYDQSPKCLQNPVCPRWQGL